MSAEAVAAGTQAPGGGQRIALGLEYDGTDFLGFQSQRAQPTVQDVTEAALSRVAAAPVRVVAAGRTDTGVHARGQVVHFDAPARRPRRAWLLGANANLPPSVAVIWCVAVPADFHARFSADARRYRYRIANRWPRPALDRRQCAWVREPLDAARMHEAAQRLVGEHDFTSFRAAGCQARHPVRRIHDVSVMRVGGEVLVDIEGNAFLHHMVRNIVGSLLLVGRGERSVDWIGEVLARRDRSLAAATADARGLCLEAVRYPARFGLPRGPMRPADR